MVIALENCPFMDSKVNNEMSKVTGGRPAGIYTQKKLAEILGISEKTFSERIKSKRFGTEEIEKLIPVLEINEPMSIFFDGLVTLKVTRKEEN